MTPESQSDAALDRIARAFDPGLFAAGGQRVVQRLADHLVAVQSREGAVLNWKDPISNIERAAGFLHRSTNASADRIDELAAVLLAAGQNLHHPRYIGHQVPPSSPIAGLFDAIGAITNQVMGVYEMGPLTTAVERAIVDELGSRIGWEPGSFSGVVTHGGSLANLTALVAARNIRCENSWQDGVDPGRRGCLVANSDAHYCIARAAGIMGLGTDNLIAAPLTADRKIDPRALDQLLSQLRGEGRSVIAVAASSCSTPIGAFDDLSAIADVCEKHGVWLHVDAAHGGGVLFSKAHRHRLEGIARADSVVWDAHKMLFVPALCAFVFFKDRAHGLAAFHQEAPYLFDDEHPDDREFDSALRTLECTKRAAALGIWGLWSLFGPELFEDLVDVTFGLTRRLHARLVEMPDFDVPHEPEANILIFRFQPERFVPREELNRMHSEVRRELIRSGRFYIVQTEIDGLVYFRVTVMNPFTSEDDFRDLIEDIRLRMSSQQTRGID